MKILITISLLMVGSSTLLRAQQNPKPELLQKKIQSCIANSYAASVYLADYDTVAKRTTGSRFSGVVVSRDGIILTAAHVGKTNKVYKVVFPDGREKIAIGLGRIQQVDAAVLKINKPGEWSFAEMGWSSSIKINEPCVSVAWPGSFTPQKTVIRFGYVSNRMDDRRGKLVTTCLMEPGDSGGPVFDLYGRVIGLHSSIALGLESNFEIPIDDFRKYWSALMKTEDYATLPQEDVIPADTMLGDRISYPKINSLESMLEKKEEKLDDVLVELGSTSDTCKAFGTLINMNGLIGKQTKSFIISKSSLIPGKTVSLLSHGTRENLNVIFRDENKDFVLLELDKRRKGGIDISLSTSKEVLNFKDLGEILISPRPQNKGEISVLGTLQFDFPGTYSSGYLGSAVELKDNQMQISMVQDNSPASRAGLKVGDEIVSLNSAVISSPEQFIKEVQKNRPKDKAHILIRREGKEESLSIILAKRPYITSNHVAERFTDGKSDRRDGFENAFVHDAKLKPNECGGPVFDLAGNFIGINMARYSRTSTIGVTESEILKFLREAITQGAFTTTLYDSK